MKPQTGMTILAIVLFAAFGAYSSLDTQKAPTDTGQANVQSVATTTEKADPEPQTPIASPEPQVDFFMGLDQEFKAIMEGNDEFQSEFDKLDSTSTSTNESQGENS